MRLFLVRVIFVVGLAPIGHGAFAQDSPPATTKTAVFAGGCFWCIQPAFDKAPGVIKTTLGYCGGTEPNPTYELVAPEKRNYRDSTQLVYDPAAFRFRKKIGATSPELCAINVGVFFGGLSPPSFSHLPPT